MMADLEPERAKQERRKAAVIVVFQAIKSVPEPVETQAVIAEIERRCAGDKRLENAAFAVLMSALMLTVKRKVEANGEAH